MANRNPIRYRGYYYDTESGLYYLNSRYYDPVTGRFVNADGYVSTGQDITGFNMFAYCGNNPVVRIDSSGQFFGSALLLGGLLLAGLFLGGCSSNSQSNTTSTSNVGAAKPFNNVQGGPNSPNCYAYAIGEKKATNPGQASNTNIKINDVQSVAKGVENDMKAKGRSVRRIVGPNDKIYENEYRIALRVGTQPFGVYSNGTLAYDYHFMVQTNTGGWAEKHGTGGDAILYDSELTPDTIPWTLGGYNYYDSEIIYFAISH